MNVRRPLFIICLLGSILLFPHVAIEKLNAQPLIGEGRFLDAELERLNALLSAPPDQRQPGIEQLFDERVDLEALSGKIFDRYLEKAFDDYTKLLEEEQLRRLIAQHRSQVATAFRSRLLADLTTQLEQRQVHTVQRLGHRLTDPQGQLDLRLSAAGNQFAVSGKLERNDAGWRLVDLTIDGQAVSDLYREYCADIFASNYSPPVLISRLERREYLQLEDFSTTPHGQLPLDWGPWRDRDIKQTPPYQVEVEEGVHYLAARDCGESVILGKFIHWNPREYPIMTWCWNATALPTGGDERYGQTNDSAAGLYVIFSQNWMGVPKQLKYVWSTTLPIGAVGRRPRIFRPWFFVLQSGAEKLGQWTFAMADLYQHHERKLGGRPADRTIALGLLTDADDTNSYAEAYYTDIRVWTREALEKGKIKNHCGSLPKVTSAPAGCP